MSRQVKTPESKAADLEKAAATVRRRYKVNIKTKRKFEFEGEEELVKDMVLVLKLANYTNTQIGHIVGVSRGQVKSYLAEPAMQKKYLKLKEALPQAALDLGKAYLIEAVQAIVHVMRTEVDNAIVLKAAADLLDRFGIPKLSRLERKTDADNPLDSIGRGGHEGIFNEVGRMSPELQEEAAKLYDLFETGMKTLMEKSEDTANEIAGSDQDN